MAIDKQQDFEPVPAEFPKLRQNFRAYLAANQNYFGNLEKAATQVVFPLAGSTAYERLGCVGFQPELNMLKGVVYINRETGYGTGPCGAGTEEYVRFFLSFDNGATWQDQGLTSFKVYNIDHNSRLEYAVEKKIKPPRKFCRVENLIRVRAILSWEVPPPPNPNWMPVWGNRVEAVIQVDPYRFIDIGVLPELNPSVLEMIDTGQTVKLKKPEASIEYIAKTARAAKLEPHRVMLPAFHEVQASPAALTPGFDPSLAFEKMKLLESAVGVDISKIIDAIVAPTDGNTSYEELTCIGLQPGPFLDELTGIIHVKKSAGYSGSLCTKGSREFIAFYMDFGAGFEYMGTASVGVNDISGIPPEGLRYAAYLPVNLQKHRRPCTEPRLVKMRAILSWAVPPPPNMPNHVPVWGNREDTLVFLFPGTQQGDKPLPFITAMGRVSTDHIDGSGLATATSPFTVNLAPFGGEVMVSGYILNHPNHSVTGTKLRYKVMVSTDGSSFTPIANDFTISIDVWTGAIVTQTDITQSVDSDGFYRYQVDAIGPDYTFVDENVLFRFYTTGMTGPRWIRIDIEDPVTLALISSNAVKIMVDNTAPDHSFELTSVTPCSDINPGDVLSGTYSGTDPHMGGVAISVAPAGGTLTVTPAVSTLTEKSGTWSLNTTGMAKCGYVLQSWASDRAIVNNAPIGNQTGVKSIGFCLR